MGRARSWVVHAVSIAAIAAAALAGGACAQAPEPTVVPAALSAPGQADPARGRVLSYTCLGCHGIDGYKNAYPDYSVPKLDGQHADYLAAALRGYRDGDRSHITMHSQASTLSDQDILDVAAHLAGRPLVSTGQTPGPLPKEAVVCVACHGQDGVAVVPMYPSLAGQHQDYLVRAVKEYRDGGRKNPIMKTIAANLSDRDIDIIAGYFSSCESPKLKTEPRPYTRFSEE